MSSETKDEKEAQPPPNISKQEANGDPGAHPRSNLAAAQTKSLNNQVQDAEKAEAVFCPEDAASWAKEQQIYLRDNKVTQTRAGNAYHGTKNFFNSNQDRLAYYFSLGTNKKWVMWLMICLFIYIVYRWLKWMWFERQGRRITLRMIWTFLLILIVWLAHMLVMAYF